MIEPPALDNVRCPTCRASQPWSDTCRRCKSDLRLLRGFAEAYQASRRACLCYLHDGDHRAARRAAMRCHSVAPTEESRRLLAVAALLDGDWGTVADVGLRR